MHWHAQEGIWLPSWLFNLSSISHCIAPWFRPCKKTRNSLEFSPTVGSSAGCVVVNKELVTAAVCFAFAWSPCRDDVEKSSGNACCSFGRHDCRARNESSLSLNIAAVFLLSPVVRLGHACSYIWIKKKHAHAEQLHRKQLLQFSSRDVKRAHVGSNIRIISYMQCRCGVFSVGSPATSATVVKTHTHARHFVGCSRP